jgi:ribosome maturation factor RimP
MSDIARLTEVIEPEANALGFELVRVKLSGAGEERTLQVMAEDPATGQLVVDQCMALSRAISERIDAIEEAGEELVRGAYNLEVSSPGIDRPLTRAKDYANWAGHEVKLSLNEPYLGKKHFRGELYGIDPRGEGTVVGIKAEDGSIDFIPLAQIHTAKLVLTDKLIAATRPLDTSGVDEVIEFEATTEEEKAD